MNLEIIGLRWIRVFMAMFLLMAPFLFTASGCNGETPFGFKNGDLIFQTSRSTQSSAIANATHSSWTHMGIVYLESGKPFVYEAAGKVKLTPLETWVKRGAKGKYVVKRLKDGGRILKTGVLKKMKKEGERLRGKPYDRYFGWSDKRIYCSELVWKIYHRGAGIRIGKLQKLKDFDLTGPETKAIMKRRYGDKIPYNETVISPVSMFNDKSLFTVFSNL
jgi:hypothetical protein